MKVRPRLSQDLETLVEVAARVRDLDGYPAYLPQDDFLGFLTKPAAVAAWVAEVDDTVVGHVALNAQTHPAAVAVIRGADIAGDLGVVARLLVDPPARRIGVGALLLEQARVAAVKDGRIPVLDVVASSAAAIRLYRTSGWEELGRCTFEIPGHPAIEEVIFAGPQ